MSDVEERPSKIRKINPLDVLESASQVTPETSNPSDNPHPITNLEDDLSPAPPNEDAQTNHSELSKSQLKKIRKREAWDAGKEDRRIFRRQKEKDKKARKAIERQELAAKIAAGEAAPLVPAPQPTHIRPQQVPVGLILDCDFNDLMTEKELISLGAQLTRSYSENRGAKFRTHLVISSWGGDLQKRFETVLARNHESWKGVMFSKENFMEAGKVVDEVMRGDGGGKILGALKVEGEESTTGEESMDHEEKLRVEDSTSTEAKEAKDIELQIKDATNGKEASDPEQMPKLEEAKPTITESSESQNQPTPSTTTPGESTNPPPAPSLVYLSSDSKHTLTTLSPYTTYIIGGIVDKNRYKGLCQKRATELGIPTAKLPIGEFMVMNSRSVLAVNHVVEIMLRWLECGDWGVAFEKVIPKRKGGVLRSKAKKREKSYVTSVDVDGNEDDGYDDGYDYEEEEEHDDDYYEVKKEQEQEYDENYEDIEKEKHQN